MSLASWETPTILTPEQIRAREDLGKRLAQDDAWRAMVGELADAQARVWATSLSPEARDGAWYQLRALRSIVDALEGTIQNQDFDRTLADRRRQRATLDAAL